MPPSVRRSADILLDDRLSLERCSLSLRRSRSRLSWFLSFLSRFDFFTLLLVLELLGRSAAAAADDDDVVVVEETGAASAEEVPCLLLLLLGGLSSVVVVVLLLFLTAGLCDGFGLRP